MTLRLTLLQRFLRRLHLLPVPVMDAFGSVLFGRALAIAVRRGMFEMLAHAPLDAETLARKTGLHPEAVAHVADACVVAGYLAQTRSRYRLSTEGRTWLLNDSPRSITMLIRYFETLHDRWRDLEHAMIEGRPRRPYYDGFTEEDWRVYVLAMRDLARVILPAIRGKIKVPNGASLLVDLGGSHGLYAADCCRRNPGLHALVLDYPSAVAAGRTLEHAARLGDRLRFEGADFMKGKIPSPADVILMVNIIHGLTVEENRTLIERALAALRPGGTLYILDQMKSEGSGSSVDRFIPLMVGLNLLSEIGGTTYTAKEVLGWCDGSGTGRIIHLRLPGVGMVEVRKAD